MVKLIALFWNVDCLLFLGLMVWGMCCLKRKYSKISCKCERARAMKRNPVQESFFHQMMFDPKYKSISCNIYNHPHRLPYNKSTHDCYKYGG